VFRAKLDNAVATPTVAVASPSVKGAGGRAAGVAAAAAALLGEDEALSIVLECNGIQRDEHIKQPHGARGAYLEVFQIPRYRRIQGLHSFGPAVKHLEIMHQSQLTHKRNARIRQVAQWLIYTLCLFAWLIDCLCRFDTDRRTVSTRQSGNVSLCLHCRIAPVVAFSTVHSFACVHVCLLYIVVLISLYLSNNRLTRLSGLESNVRLRELYLGENTIPRIEGLHTLRALTILSLYDNDIAAIEGLEHNAALTELNLARNHIHHVGQSVDGDTIDAVNA
jgi:hypothetical protein